MGRQFELRIARLRWGLRHQTKLLELGCPLLICGRYLPRQHSPCCPASCGHSCPLQLLTQVKDKLQVNNAPSIPSTKSNIFSPRSSLHRVPLTSRRNTNNFPSPASSNGLKLPQAAAANSQQQLLQQNSTGLYSPRISNGFLTHRSNFGTSPKGTPRGSRREHASQMPQGNLQQSSLAASSSVSTAAQQAAHAAAAAKRLSLGQLKQFQQQQQQLFSPRHDKSAAKGALTARGNLQNTSESLISAKLAQHDNGSWTWRSQHAQQAPVQAGPAQQPVQPLHSTHSPTRCPHVTFPETAIRHHAVPSFSRLACVCIAPFNKVAHASLPTRLKP